MTVRKNDLRISKKKNTLQVSVISGQPRAGKSTTAHLLSLTNRNLPMVLVDQDPLLRGLQIKLYEISRALGAAITDEASGLNGPKMQALFRLAAYDALAPIVATSLLQNQHVVFCSPLEGFLENDSQWRTRFEDMLADTAATNGKRVQISYVWLYTNEEVFGERLKKDLGIGMNDVEMLASDITGHHRKRLGFLDRVDKENVLAQDVSTLTPLETARLVAQHHNEARRTLAFGEPSRLDKVFDFYGRRPRAAAQLLLDSIEHLN